MKYLIYILAITSTLYPVFVWFRNSTFSLDFSVFSVLFPLFGILAFMIMWLHIVGEAIEEYLQKFVDFKKFVAETTTYVLILILLHPLVLFVSLKNPFLIFNIYQRSAVWIALIGFFVLISYDIAKLFRHREFFIKNWEWVKFVSVIGFFIIFFHSINIGSDLQSGFLRNVWIFYGVTAGIATIYTYGVKKFLDKNKNKPIKPVNLTED